MTEPLTDRLNTAFDAADACGGNECRLSGIPRDSLRDVVQLATDRGWLSEFRGRGEQLKVRFVRFRR
jgi:hypothetical protein